MENYEIVGIMLSQRDKLPFDDGHPYGSRTVRSTDYDVRCGRETWVIGKKKKPQNERNEKLMYFT